ncbi:MAG: DUF1080 domain-containing protein [Armatimonadota bacterium]
MNPMRKALAAGLTAVLAVFWLLSAGMADDETGFVPLFDGESLDGWTGGNYIVEDGVLVCPQAGGGKLLTEKQYDDFVFRFEFRLPPGGNNGVAVRAPAKGNPAYAGMEIQILDNTAEKYANLRPAQYHGSIYDVVPAKRGALKPVGAWNEEEILANGRHVKVTLNGQVIVDADLDAITDAETLKRHPGLQRGIGHLGFIGHGDRIEFRNIRIKELHTPNVAPPGYVALFNGEDLSGWKGLVSNPPARAKMTPERLAAAQQEADANMRAHWKVEEGVLAFDGKGHSLCTSQDYGDFELVVEWKIEAGGDSGIYLRGSPQVQIWDRPVGSGGLYNNKKEGNPSQPLLRADRPVGEWNRFRITMIGEKVTVHLNGELVVDNVTMENYWERDKPIYPTGQIELQSHNSPLWFRNIFIREIASPATE